MYSTNLYINLQEPINLELEKLTCFLMIKVIGTIEINRSINDLKILQRPYIDEKAKKKLLKTCPLPLPEFWKNTEIYNSLGDGMFI